MRKVHKKRKICGILLIITALIIMQLPAAEADAAASASDFKIEGNTLVKYRGTETNVSVPGTVEVIGKSAFEGNDLIELVVLPNSVERIEPYAFWGCENLDTVVLGTGLKEVGDYAFTNCSGLEKMTIPANIKSIGIQAFTDCVNLEHVSVSPETIFIHETAFDGCYKLQFHCDAGTVADKFAKEFYEKQKEMPEYEDVPDYREPTEEDGDNEDASKDENVNQPETSTGGGSLLGSTKIVGNQAVVFIDNTSPEVLSGIQSEPLSEEKTGAKYTIVDGKVVADQAYYKNLQLEGIVLPDGIEEVGQFSFARSSIERIEFPDTVTQISYGAFYHCDKLKKVVLPETIKVVEPKAFAHSEWVDAFLEKRDSGQDELLISGGVLVAYRGNKASVLIPEGVRVIAGEAFAGHRELHSVTFPDSLLSVGEGAFEGCSGLSEIRFGEQPLLETIKDRAFSNCALSELTLPASVKTVGLGAFDSQVQIAFAGDRTPERTYETSAQRLSNEAYRGLREETGASGVSVTGISDAYAKLDGAAREYHLSIEPLTASELLQKAYLRSLGASLPEHLSLYQLELCDNSQIPLTKLGKQFLTVTLPVPEMLSGEEILIYTTDRNGQLEEIPSGRVSVDGVESIRFSIRQVAVIGLLGTGSPCDEGNILEETVEMQQLSAPIQENAGVPLQVKYLLGGAFLLTGFLLLFIGTKKKNRN